MIDGKARTWKQWQARKKKEELERIDKHGEPVEKKRYGVCEECGSGRSRLKIENRQLVKVCKDCQKEMVV